MKRSPPWMLYFAMFSFGKLVQIISRHEFLAFSGTAVLLGRRLVGICNNILKELKLYLADPGETNLRDWP